MLFEIQPFIVPTYLGGVIKDEFMSPLTFSLPVPKARPSVKRFVSAARRAADGSDYSNFYEFRDD